MNRLRPMALILALIAPGLARADILVDFSDRPLAPNSFNNGSDQSGGFTSKGAFFNNIYTPDPQFPSWSGWSTSNVNDTTTYSFMNQYAAITGGALDPGSTYGVAFDYGPNASFLNLPDGASPASVYLTNTTYAYLSMLGYDQLPGGYKFAKKFTTNDFLSVEITGYAGLDASGTSVGTVNFDLARYKSPDDHPVNSWTFVDLSKLSGARSLGFAMASSDTGQFGINTPTYFALDNLLLNASAVPEPSALILLAAGLLAVVGVRRLRFRPGTDGHRGAT